MMPKNEWSVPHQTPILLNDDIHVWRASLEVPSARLEYLYRMLSEDEVIRAKQYCFEQDRRRFIIRRGLLRRILSGYLGQSPSKISFSYNSYGKPALASISGKPTLYFNMSHSCGLAIYAITRSQEVGVDIERIRPSENAEDIVKRFFSSREKAEFSTLPERIKKQAFFTCWTRKEAYIKARGEGLSHPLDQFSVSLIPGEPARLLSCHNDSCETERWDLRELTVNARYVATLAFEGRHDSKLRCFHVKSDHCLVEKDLK